MEPPTLLYISSSAIVDFVSHNPIYWPPRELTKIGGLADQAGIPPVPSVQSFLGLLGERRELFTQAEFADRCISDWGEWFGDLTEDIQHALRMKQYRNFYPSLVDSLHAWALIVETCDCDSCFINAYLDAVSKTDLIVIRGDSKLGIKLVGPTPYADQCRIHKQSNREFIVNLGDCVTVKMPCDRERNPGNKRWYFPEDFSIVKTYFDSHERAA